MKLSPSVPVGSFRWLSPDKNWRIFPNKKSLLVALENETEELIKVKAQIEQVYGCDVAGVLPHSDEWLPFASRGTFALRYPDHPLTRIMKQIMTVLVQ